MKIDRYSSTYTLHEKTKKLELDVNYKKKKILNCYKN